MSLLSGVVRSTHGESHMLEFWSEDYFKSQFPQRYLELSVHAVLVFQCITCANETA